MERIARHFEECCLETWGMSHLSSAHTSFLWSLTWLPEMLGFHLYQCPSVPSLKSLCAQNIYVHLKLKTITFTNVLYLTLNVFADQYNLRHITHRLGVCLCFDEDVEALPLPQNIKNYLHYNLLDLLDIFKADDFDVQPRYEYYRAMLKYLTHPGKTLWTAVYYKMSLRLKHRRQLINPWG